MALERNDDSVFLEDLVEDLLDILKERGNLQVVGLNKWDYLKPIEDRPYVIMADGEGDEWHYEHMKHDEDYQPGAVPVVMIRYYG